MTTIRTILVPFDFSANSEAALDTAEELAIALGADLHLLHVVQPPGYLYATELHPDLEAGMADAAKPLIDGCLQRLEEVAATRRLPAARIHLRVTEASQVAHAIAQEAESIPADLIAMGTHGRTGLAHLLMGSVAEETMRRAPCPVLSVPRAHAALRESHRWEASRHPAEGSF